MDVQQSQVDIATSQASLYIYGRCNTAMWPQAFWILKLDAASDPGFLVWLSPLQNFATPRSWLSSLAFSTPDLR